MGRSTRSLTIMGRHAKLSTRELAEQYSLLGYKVEELPDRVIVYPRLDGEYKYEKIAREKREHKSPEA